MSSHHSVGVSSCATLPSPALPSRRDGTPSSATRWAPRDRSSSLLSVLRAIASFALVIVVPGIACGEQIRLDADEAARRAVEASSAAAAAAARLAIASAGVDSSDATRLPIVSATASVTQRSSVPEFGIPTSPGGGVTLIYPNIPTAYAAGLRADQTIYAGGAIDAARSAARADRTAAAAQRDRVLADLRLAGRLTYWESVRARASVVAAQANEARSRRLLDDTLALFSAGMAVRADVLAAEERTASARVAVVRAEAATAEAEAQLRSLLALGPDDDIVPTDTITGQLPPSPPPLAELTERALAGRPELAALGAQRDAAAMRELLAGAPSRPTLGLSAQWELSRPNSRYFPLADEWHDTWSVGLTSQWRLFDGGKSRADVGAARALRGALGRDLEEATRLVRLEVEVSHRELTAALATVEAADSARAAADERDRAANERFGAGLAAMTEILDARAALALAEQQQISSRAAAWMAAARIQRAINQ